ncbi:hypothetical protein IJS18_00190 [Candidatus Saccharibacteria bacterium]|nr:hypothetical protein [Candidatus Saccharibacteria bacterium]
MKKRVIAAVLLLVVVIIAAITFITTREGEVKSIYGTWALDETSYQFNVNRTGKLVLKSGEYDFTYEKDSNEISIDFKDEKITDSIFKYSFENDKLVLERGANKSVFIRVEDETKD